MLSYVRAQCADMAGGVLTSARVVLDRLTIREDAFHQPFTRVREVDTGLGAFAEGGHGTFHTHYCTVPLASTKHPRNLPRDVRVRNSGFTR